MLIQNNITPVNMTYFESLAEEFMLIDHSTNHIFDDGIIDALNIIAKRGCIVTAEQITIPANKWNAGDVKLWRAVNFLEHFWDYTVINHNIVPMDTTVSITTSIDWEQELSKVRHAAEKLFMEIPPPKHALPNHKYYLSK